MKRLLTIALVMVLALFLVACHGKTGRSNSTPSSNNSTSGNNNPASTNNGGNGNNGGNNDKSTVVGFLAQFGLKEDDFKPEGYVSSMLSDGDTVKYTTNETPTVEQRKAWANMVIAKAKSMSTDGKLYTGNYYTSGKTDEFDTAIDEGKYTYTNVISVAFSMNGKATCFQFNWNLSATNAFEIRILQK